MERRKGGSDDLSPFPYRVVLRIKILAHDISAV